MWWPPVPSISLQMTGFHSLLQLNKTLLYISKCLLNTALVVFNFGVGLLLCQHASVSWRLLHAQLTSAAPLPASIPILCPLRFFHPKPFPCCFMIQAPLLLCSFMALWMSRLGAQAWLFWMTQQQAWWEGGLCSFSALDIPEPVPGQELQKQLRCPKWHHV